MTKMCAQMLPTKDLRMMTFFGVMLTPCAWQIVPSFGSWNGINNAPPEPARNNNLFLAHFGSNFDLSILEIMIKMCHQMLPTTDLRMMTFVGDLLTPVFERLSRQLAPGMDSHTPPPSRNFDAFLAHFCSSRNNNLFVAHFGSFMVPFGWAA